MGVSEIMGTLFWGPYNKDPTIQGTISGSPIIFGNSHIGCRPVEGFPQEVQTSSPRILNEKLGSCTNRSGAPEKA